MVRAASSSTTDFPPVIEFSIDSIADAMEMSYDHVPINGFDGDATPCGSITTSQ
jgi:hypothetical protein